MPLKKYGHNHNNWPMTSPKIPRQVVCKRQLVRDLSFCYDSTSDAKLQIPGWLLFVNKPTGDLSVRKDDTTTTLTLALLLEPAGNLSFWSSSATSAKWLSSVCKQTGRGSWVTLLNKYGPDHPGSPADFCPFVMGVAGGQHWLVVDHRGSVETSSAGVEASSYSDRMSWWMRIYIAGWCDWCWIYVAGHYLFVFIKNFFTVNE